MGSSKKVYVNFGLLRHEQNWVVHFGGHPLSTCAKFSEKLTFLTVVRIRGLEMLVFWKIFHTHLMDDPLHVNN